VTDNNDISMHEEDGTVSSFRSFSELLSETSCPYQKIVENEEVIRHIILQANNKLTEIRKENPSAGGLVIASSVAHASKILYMLKSELNVHAVMATYQEHEATNIIGAFKISSTPWIVSVGMISEGTNIPRLQVCCHLTRIKTELNFRQNLGRILRVTDMPNQEAYLFMPAESRLIEYAHRIAEDIPDNSAIIRYENSDTSISINENDESKSEEVRNDHPNLEYEIKIDETKPTTYKEKSLIQSPPSLLTQTYEATLNVFGQFHQDILALNVSPFD
jgi:superfamily II DNA or RNA helicase